MLEEARCCEAHPAVAAGLCAGAADRRRSGNDLIVAGRIEEAIAVLQEELAAEPGDPAVHLDLGAALRLAGRAAESAVLLRTALELQPRWPSALYNLGTSLMDLGDLRGAAEAFRETMTLQPEWSLPHRGLGFALYASGELDDAKATLGRALALDAGDHLLRHQLAGIHWASDDHERTIEIYRQGIAQSPAACQECHFALGLALLSAGDYADGWAEYEWRWDRGGAMPGLTGLDRPVWDGSPLAGRTIVLWAEQGLGDILMFARFAPLVHARGGTVCLLSRPNLDRLLASCPGVSRVTSDPGELGDYDCQAPLGSLPRLLGLSFADLPAIPVPYLAPPPGKGGDPLGPRRESELRVGVVWAVEPGQPGWEVRSTPLPLWQALASVPGVELYSLQFGGRSAELRGPGTPPMADLAAVLGDFASTAALVSHLDLVITVDTSMAHLAGAIGQPVWTLLPRGADWRWLHGREDTPWYPTMRLFRQGSGGWEPLLEQVATALRELRERAA